MSTDPFAAAGVVINRNASAPAAGGSMLSSVTTGIQQTGQRLVVCGVEKIGKTTFACQAPRPLLVPLEVGFASMAVPKTRMPTTFGEVMGLIEEVKQAAMRGQFDRKTLVFDTGTALERLVDLQTIADDPKSNHQKLTMETAHGAYGKAYAHSNMLFDRFLKACDELAIYGGINIVITAHVFASRGIDPIHGEFDTWDLLLHSPKNQKTHGKREMLTQWADLVGLIYEPVFISKGEGEQLAKATTMNQGRVMGVSRTPGYVAGNRYGLSGTIPLPEMGGWNNVARRIWEARGIDIGNHDA
jgi:hypothetical protein